MNSTGFLFFFSFLGFKFLLVIYQNKRNVLVVFSPPFYSLYFRSSGVLALVDHMLSD